MEPWRERGLTKQVSPCLLRGSRAYIVLCLYGCNVLSGFVQKVSSHGNFFNLVPGHFILQPQGRQRRESGHDGFLRSFYRFQSALYLFLSNENRLQIFANEKG